MEVSVKNWQYYTDSIKTLSIVRGLLDLAAEIKMTTPKTVKTDISDFIERATKLSDISGGSNIKSAHDLVLPMIEKVEQAVKTRGALSGMMTGFVGLDDKLDGFQNEYIIIGARPSVGKTSIIVNMMNRQAKKGINVGFISAEMKDVKIMMRLLSDVANINARSLRNGLLSDRNIQQVCISGEQIAGYPLFIDDSSRELAHVISSCRSMVRIMGVQIIYIDHAGMINVNDDTPQWEKSSKISKTIKNVQKELSVPIVLLSQVGRQAENKAPTLADLRGSGSFEEDADTVMFLHRERLESVNDEPIPAELNIAKCRDGEIGLVELLFFPKLTRFMDKAEKRFEK
jgi:replicative DNA helicase